MIIISGCGCLLDILMLIAIVIVWILKGACLLLVALLILALLMGLAMGANALYRKARGKEWKEGNLIKKIKKIFKK